MITKKPTIFWLTGLSGSGKSTLGSWLTNEFNRSGSVSVFLDGDELRKIYADYSTDQLGRLKIGYRNFRLCEYLVAQEFNVIMSVVGMRSELFNHFKSMSVSTCLIHLNVPLPELVRRDPKGIYKKFFRGEMKDVSGMDYAVDTPPADLIVNWVEGMTIPGSKMKLLSLLKDSGYIDNCC